MTSRITSVQSAKYDEHNRAVFTVTVGDITDVETYIFNRPQDAVNDSLLRKWLADENNSVAAYVPDPEPIPDPRDITRRNDRQEEFANTLDRLNPIWYNSLTTEQRTELATWRTAWLDYPEASEETTRPVRPEGIF